MTTASPPTKKRTFFRQRLPLVILGVGLLVGLALWFWPGESLEPAQRNFSLMLLTQLTVLLMLLWLIGFSGIRWIYRFAIVALVIGLPFAAVRQVRFTGDMVPSVEWRWESHDDSLEAHRRSAKAAALQAPIDVRNLRGEFTEYRGRDRKGVARIDTGVGVGLELNHPPSRWRQPIGGGYASFAVVGPIGVTIEQRRNQEVVVTYGVDTGAEIWSHAYEAHFKEVLGGPGPRATPTIADGDVYSLGATGWLRCLDASTGQLKWSVNILENNKNVMWGMAGSPLVYDNVVVVNPGSQTTAAAGRAVVAYDRKTGKEVWASGTTRAGYASPMLATLCGKRQVLIFDGEEIAGYDATSGTKLWSRPWITQQGINIAQPLVLDEDRVFVSSGYNVGCAMLKISDNNGQWTVTSLWGDAPNKAMRCKMSSPVYSKGYIYGLDEGFLACIDAKTGRRQWRDGRYGHGQMLLLSGNFDALVVLTEAGKVTGVEATPEAFREFDSFQAIDGKTWNYPAFSEGKIWVRNHLEMACYQIVTYLGDDW